MQAYQHRQLEALGDATRRALVTRLREGPLPVGQLAHGLPVSRPAVSQHLKVLKEAQLVRDKARGTRRYYELDPRGFASLRTYFDGFWGDALQSFKIYLEGEEDGDA